MLIYYQLNPGEYFRHAPFPPGFVYEAFTFVIDNVLKWKDDVKDAGEWIFQDKSRFLHLDSNFYSQPVKEKPHIRVHYGVNNCHYRKKIKKYESLHGQFSFMQTP